MPKYAKKIVLRLHWFDSLMVSEKGTKSNEIVRAYYEREFATLSKRFAVKIISVDNGNAY